MEYDHPTAADYAGHNANEALKRIERLEGLVRSLTQRIVDLENALGRVVSGEAGASGSSPG